MKKIIVMALMFVLSITMSIPLDAAIPASERSALIALYNAANGDSWSKKGGWKDGILEPDGFGPVGSEGTWYGITVVSDHVTQIDLSFNNLTGTIPSQLEDLTYLSYLSFWYNFLSGSIPIEMGNLGNLEILYLGYNELTGSIPPQLGNLSKLQRIYLISNNLTGSIPPQLGNLGNLQTLWVGHNQLSGSIPSELGDLGNLKDLRMDYNDLTGTIPPQLGNLSNLETLNLDGNNLTGSIPPQLGNLGKLYFLSLGQNDLNGSIPPELGNLGNLSYLNLWYNDLSDSIPAKLKDLGKLDYLNLSYNQLTGSIPAILGNLNTLKNLYLMANRLSGSIPSELGNLGSLEDLLLNGNQLTGSIPTSLINLTNLSSTNIGYNGLYTDDVALRAFLDGKDPDWESTQTTAPTNVSAAASSTTSIDLSWSPIIYTGNTGGYEVYYSLVSGRYRTYSGITSNKSMSSYTVSGLVPGAVYFFVIKTRTNPHGSNTNTVVSEYSEEVSTATHSAVGTHTLTVLSSPGAGANITVAPNDKGGNGNGTTHFARYYNEGTIVTLTAPAAYGGSNFLKWKIDGADNTGRTVQVTMNSSHTAKAVYGGGPDTYTLTVQSSPGTGAAITVTPEDNSGKGNGTTDFTRTYTGGTNVSLTAPNSHNGKDFLKWTIDGTGNSDQTIQVTMNSSHTAVAYYATAAPPEILLNRTTLNFGAVVGGDIPGSQQLTVTSGGGTLNWTAFADAPWLKVNPSSGTGSAVVAVTVNPSALTAGTYTGTITVSDANASNSPRAVGITLKIYNAGETSGPFGKFETPLDASTVRSSIAVSGWVLDDIGVEYVKIYREDGGNQVYIGDAVFVEDARPDVEQAYPDYPMNYQAGWGYMMLTNFLPNAGNGTFTIHAAAADTEGNTVTLGTKTIYCNNANAVKPFGAVDTPTQGGTASGSSFINWGWVLTPQPNSIPTDGSTINVWVDGVNLGHPAYNIYRSDIAGLFPGYANSNGAVGYFYLDTIPYTNGVHTIYWTAADNAGNTDGIGSRYFTVQNTGGDQQFSVDSKNGMGDFSRIPVDYYEPVEIIKGYNLSKEPEIFYPDEKGMIRIEIKELERLEIHFNDTENPNFKFQISNSYTTAHQVIGNRVKPLPIGSTFDAEKNIFYWQAGPGFIGTYRFVFVKKSRNDEMSRKEIDVIIRPKFDKEMN